ncbi:hypothetical protein CSDK_0467 [Streptococcus dysgalactiae]
MKIANNPPKNPMSKMPKDFKICFIDGMTLPPNNFLIAYKTLLNYTLKKGKRKVIHNLWKTF